MRLVHLVLLLSVTAACTREPLDPGQVADEDGDGFSAAMDCDDLDADVNPDAAEICDERDNDCDEAIDEGVQLTFYADADGDGHGGEQFTAEACAAGNGYVASRDDCNDVDPAVSPSQAEVCDGKDNNCDGVVDEGVTTTYWADGDGDGFGDARAVEERCEGGAGWVTNSDDCNDSNGAISPDAEELCNDGDDDCDGEADEGLDITVYSDADGDGFGLAGTERVDCEVTAGHAAAAGDCNDENGDVNPDASEVCNGVDDNCDGGVDESLLTDFYQDSDGDGFGNPAAVRAACEQPSDYVLDNSDCDDESDRKTPGLAESCDGLDNNCDGTVDEGVERTFYADLDADGFGADSDTETGCVLPDNHATQGGDCDDNEPEANPATEEICDGIDNNCDDDIDESGLTRWYLDSDEDGIGGDIFEDACSAPSEAHVTTGADCDDDDAQRAPTLPETCDGVDNDCDETVDENVTVQVFADVDGDGFGDVSAAEDRCSDGDGFVYDDTDCADDEPGSNPEAAEVCDTADNDCDGDVDEGTQIPIFVDGDGDGFGDASAGEACAAGSGESDKDGDCDDDDDAIFPGATDAPGDGIDQDCDGIDPQLPVGQVCFDNDSTIKLGALLEGSITDGDQDSAGQPVDDHEVVLTGGTSYTVGLWSEQIDTVVEVYDENCDLVGRVDQGAGIDDNTGAVLTPSSDGVFTLMVLGFRTWERGAYRLRVTETLDNGECGVDGLIGVGEDTRVILDANDQTDGANGGYSETYSVWLEAGESVTAQALSSSVDAYVAVLDRSCTTVEEDDGSSYTDNARVTFSASASGWYAVVVGSAKAGETGVVDLQLARGRVGYTCFDNTSRSTLPRSITNGAFKSSDNTTGGPFGDGAYWDDYEVVAAPSLGATAHVASAEVGVQVAAYDDTCALLEDPLSLQDDEHDASDSRSVWASPAAWSEVMTFVVQGTEDAAEGGMLIDLAPQGAWDSCGLDARGILERETVHGLLDGSDDADSPHTGHTWDDYEVFMEAGERMYFVADSDEADLAMAVLDDSCAVIASSNAVTGQPSKTDAPGISFSAPYTGVFSVAVSAEDGPVSGSADYWLTASPNSFDGPCGDDATPITPGGTRVTETLDTDEDESGIRTEYGTHYHDDYTLYLAKGQSVRLDLTSSYDNFVMVLDSDCNVLGSDDDSGPDFNAQLDFTAQVADRYTVISTSWGSSRTGNYVLTTTELSGF